MDSEVLAALLGPVVLVSSTGMLCMSTSARMTSVLGRIRELHREQLALRLRPPNELPALLRTVRTEGLERQTEALIRQAARLRDALMLLYVAILILVVAGLCIGFSRLGPQLAILDWGGTLGVMLAMVSVGVAAGILLFETRRAIENVAFEHDRIGRVEAAREASRPEEG